MKIGDVIERLGAIIGGEEDLIRALNTLKDDTAFRVIGDLPVGPLLNMLGLTNNKANNEMEIVTDIPVQDEA